MAKSLAAKMYLEEPLLDIVSKENAPIVFKCKIADCESNNISCKWFKDGQQIEASGRFEISNEGKLYILQITSATLEDYGVYYILLKNDINEIFSTANLYIKDPQDEHRNDVLRINAAPPFIKVTRQLRRVKASAGLVIELEASFSADVIGDYLWYKSNQELFTDERMIKLSDDRTAFLTIMWSRESDTGIYEVVCKSAYGVASSSASVIVIDSGTDTDTSTDPGTATAKAAATATTTDTDTTTATATATASASGSATATGSDSDTDTDIDSFSASEFCPKIEEPLPDEVEVNVGEEARLMCKVSYDCNTIIGWCKNGTVLKEDNKFSMENYNHRYACLRIKNVSLTDRGEYTIFVEDVKISLDDISTCLLNVNVVKDLLTDSLSSVQLTVPLQSIITCVGCALSMNCSFDLDGENHYYVVWYIGHYRVERTNHRFHVTKNGGDFFLFIKQVEPGMSGEVTCELRQALPNRRSVLLKTVTASLTIVPSSALHNEVVESNNTTWKCDVFNIGNSHIHVPVKNISAMQEFEITTNAEKGMVITYCRLNNYMVYCDILNSDGENYVHYVSLCEKYVHCDSSKPLMVIIEWFNCTSNGSDLNESQKKQYNIEFSNSCDDFVDAGDSSMPMLELKDPPLEHVMKFRITFQGKAQNAKESKVCIAPAVPVSRSINKEYDVQPMHEFPTLFEKTGHTIGSGAFGRVILVKDNFHTYYAAKILKTKMKKKRDAAIREYKILKNINHPKIVDLYCAFIEKDSFIFVMDYLWGGELFDRIVDEDTIKECDVVPYVRQICEALCYLHSSRIVHMDIKPENIICMSPNSRQLKIVDFGLARVLEDCEIRAIYGTRDYVAPEVLNFEPLTFACDMWSLGVVTYMLLSGVLPFCGESWPERSANISKANYNYNESAFKEISALAKDFIDHLFVLQPENRMKAFEALNHKWIVEGPPEGTKSGHMKQTRENLKTYLANRARWQRAGNVMIAAHRLRIGGSLRNTQEADGSSAN